MSIFNNDNYDIIIIGGGATGLGVAVDAQTRGYKTLLFEAYDFGKGTSSKSTKLVHGGIRYLANLDIALVKEGLTERYYFLNNAPHLAKPQTYLVPFYSWLDKLKYYVGVRLYDFLSGKHKVGKSKFLSKQEVLEFNNAPDLKDKKLIGGVIYYDGQFDDTRLLISLLRTYQANGGEAFNYAEVIEILKDANGMSSGVKIHNKLTNVYNTYYAKVVVNATGVLTDSILNIDDVSKTHHNVTAAQGTHLVFNKELFNSPHALVIPKTMDNRILFVLPWLDKIVVGTTDIKVDVPVIEPIAQPDEIDFILDTLNLYAKHKATKGNIKSKFTGLRPLVTTENNKSSSKISRKHEILQSESNLITIVGGKWTIYRLMGEDTIDYLIKHNLIANKGSSVTKSLHLFGYTTNPIEYPFKAYGSDCEQVIKIQKELNNFDKLHNGLPYFQAEVIYHVRYEMAKTVEDILARRTRALFLDAKASIEIAPLVAKLMASELKKDSTWVAEQIEVFNRYASNYIL